MEEHTVAMARERRERESYTSITLCLSPIPQPTESINHRYLASSLSDTKYIVVIMINNYYCSYSKNIVHSCYNITELIPDNDSVKLPVQFTVVQVCRTIAFPHVCTLNRPHIVSIVRI